MLELENLGVQPDGYLRIGGPQETQEVWWTGLSRHGTGLD